jgi:hypothetical protein
MYASNPSSSANRQSSPSIMCASPLSRYSSTT